STSTQKFALFFGNRGFFPEKLISSARKELSDAVKSAGYESVMMKEDATRYGAIESTAEGLKYAKWLADQQDISGVILCLPNFGDETGAVAALEEAGVPIWIVAYPDEMGRLGIADRRDAYCGNFSVMDVFYQYKVPYTSKAPHVLDPKDPKFTDQLHYFSSVCRVVKQCRKFTIGAIGARTTAFKTVRYDELALQKSGITTEVLDLSEIISRTRAYDTKNEAYKLKAEKLTGITDMSLVPDESVTNMVKLAMVLDEVSEEYGMDALAVRCWIELEKELKIAPCTILGELNDRGVAAACELDVGNALAMHALKAASDRPATVLDWNNNWKDEDDKCILFHCGPVPPSLMQKKGYVIDHPMFKKTLGPGCGWGPNQGRIKPMPLTYASTKTEDGKIWIYGGEGQITEDVIPEEFFGCAGVAEIQNLQSKLNIIGKTGYRHHVSITPGHVYEALREGLGNYLGYNWTDLD
ncbi:MAG: hypothetical protein KAH21_13410, partial [Spirochaetaceae bacterium]|nr:hypothetical protein [Spirochaetaceae bacterium]